VGVCRWASCSSQLCDVGVGWSGVGEILRWLGFEESYKGPAARVITIIGLAIYERQFIGQEFFILGLEFAKRVAEEYHVTWTMAFVPSQSFEVFYLPAPCIYLLFEGSKGSSLSPCLLQPRGSVCSDEKNVESPFSLIERGSLSWERSGCLVALILPSVKGGLFDRCCLSIHSVSLCSYADLL